MLPASPPSLPERIKAVEDSHLTLEMGQRDVPRFRGSYQRGKRYERGEWVVSGGSTWACTKDTTEPPGDHTDGWIIAARRGREARSEAR